MRNHDLADYYDSYPLSDHPADRCYCTGLYWIAIQRGDTCRLRTG